MLKIFKLFFVFSIFILSGCTGDPLSEKLVLTDPSSNVIAPQVNDTWNMFRHDASHSGYVKSHPPTTPTILWDVNIGPEFYLHSSPAVANKMVYIGAKGVLLAFKETNGQTVWKAPFDGEMYASPAYDPEARHPTIDFPIRHGMVYAVSYGDSKSSMLAACDADTGRKIWYAYMSTKSSPVIAKNPPVLTSALIYPPIPRATLYIGAYRDLYAIDADTGTVLWKFYMDSLMDIKDIIDSTPVVYNNMVIVATKTNMIYAINRYTGKGIWKFETKGPVISSPAAGEKLLFAASTNGIVYCIERLTGNLVWAQSYASADEALFNLQSSPAYYDGYVYIGYGSKLLKLDENGQVIWQAFTPGDIMTSSPALSKNYVFIGSSKSKSSSIFCFDITTGKLVWSKWMQIDASPSLAYWSLLVPTIDGHLYCINDVK